MRRPTLRSTLRFCLTVVHRAPVKYKLTFLEGNALCKGSDSGLHTALINPTRTLAEVAVRPTPTVAAVTGHAAHATGCVTFSVNSDSEFSPKDTHLETKLGNYGSLATVTH